LPRPRKPTELLELTGAFAKNPSRTRPVGAKSEHGLGEPPAHLLAEEAACWHEVVGNSAANVLTSADRVLVEMVARLLARSRVEWLKGAEWALMLQCLVRLGWTPADRSKVAAIGQDDAPDEFAEFRH